METGFSVSQLVTLLILIIFIIFIIVAPLPLYRLLRRRLASSIERRDFSHREAELTGDQKRYKRRQFPFTLAAAVNTVLAGVCLSVMYFAPIDREYLPQQLNSADFLEWDAFDSLQLPFWCLALVFYFLTFREHIRPFSKRRRKYDYALSGMASLWVGQYYSEANVTGDTLWLILQPVIFLLLLLGASLILIRVCQPDEVPSQFARKLHSRIKQVTPAVVIISLIIVMVYPLFVLFLVARYHAVQWMENIPILYLRSFSQADAPKVFRQIVSRTCNRYGVVLALVHTQQSGTELRGDSTFYEGSQLTATSDEKWKSWVTEKLSTASAVIIDDTEETAGIDWEVAKARQICDSSQIAILRKKESEKPSHPDIWHLEYEEIKPGYKKARRDLRDWLVPIILGENSS